jgi:hypothetical protein
MYMYAMSLVQGLHLYFAENNLIRMALFLWLASYSGLNSYI